MAASALTYEMIQASVLDYWAANYTATLNVLYPGGQLDTHDVAEWVEIAVESVTWPDQRDASLVEVVVHCWAKFGTNQARASELADAAVKKLEQAQVALKDYATAGNPTVGYLRLFDSKVTDRTREEQDRQATSLSHYVVRVKGVATAL